MSNYIVSNSLIDGIYELHYDAVKDTGYVERSTKMQPKVQVPPIPHLIDDIGLARYKVFDAIVSAWFKEHVSCEFNAKEFYNFCNSFTVPEFSSPKDHIKACEYSFADGIGYVTIRFDDEVSCVEDLINDSREEDRILYAALCTGWDAMFSKFKTILSSSEVGAAHGGPKISESCKYATYKLIRI